MVVSFNLIKQSVYLNHHVHFKAFFFPGLCVFISARCEDVVLVRETSTIALYLDENYFNCIII